MKVTETGGHVAPRSSVLFKIGPLRFDSHGTAGILSFIFVAYALITQKAYEQTVTRISSSEDNEEVLPSSSSSQIRLPAWLLSSIVCTSLTCSIGSYRLLSQSPISTPIFFSVVRTSAPGCIWTNGVHHRLFEFEVVAWNGVVPLLTFCYREIC